MKKILFAVMASFASVVTMAAVPSSLTAAQQVVPTTMNFQGRLIDPSSGNAYVNGTYTLDIRLYYSTDANATAVWGGRYSAYVNDGYFNIMLGTSANAVSPTPTYGPTYLWKALWPDSANMKKDFYLGVTPWQDSSHRDIAEANRTELTPRQSILVAPFSYRSQCAYFAVASQSDFTVPGTLTANKLTLTSSPTITIPGVLSATSGASPKFGTTSSTSSLEGSTVTVKGTSGVELKTTASGSNITIAPQGTTSISGQGFTVNSTSTNFIKSTSSTTIQGSTVTVKGTSSLTLGQEGTSSVFAYGNSVYLHPKTYLYLGLLATTNTYLRGANITVQGTNKINLYADKIETETSTLGSTAPFRHRRYIVTIPANQSYAEISVSSDFPETRYKSVSSGMNMWFHVEDPNRMGVFTVYYTSGKKVRLVMQTSYSVAYTMTVHVFAICNNWVD